MTTFFLTTKFHIPRPGPLLVERPRLFTRMNQGLERTLTLVCAPAGYGKSTLLAEWVSQFLLAGSSLTSSSSQPDPLRVCWLGLDPDDDDPARFFSYFCASFEAALAGISAEAVAMQGSYSGSPAQSILTLLINRLQEISAAVVLVLDDYQFISNKTIHEGLAFLLEHLPPHIHVVIATRSDPPIPLARLRARQQLIEIRAEDLRFSLAETDDLFNQVMELNLASPDTERLEERTEGWIAGLQMAALAIKGIPGSNQANTSLFVKNFSGSNRYILDYLVEEVLSHQPTAVKDFLLRTSILEQLNGGLCDAVTQIHDQNPDRSFGSSQSFLEYLERSNLFLISLDSERLWFRYHHLFADLLRARLRQSQDAGAVQDLYRRASQWYESQGFLAEAIAQALGAPDRTYAVEILERKILTFFYQSEITQVHRWLEMLPEPLLLQHPLLCAVYAAAVALLPPYPPQSLPAVEKWMRTAESKLEDGTQHQDLTRAFISSIRTYWARFRGETPEIVRQLIGDSLALLPDDPARSLDRNYLYLRSALQTILGLVNWDSGDEEAAWQAFLQAHSICRESGDLFNDSASIIYLARINILHGQLEEAAALSREALAFFDSQRAYLGHRVPYSGEIGVQLAEILIEQNELAEVERILKENIELAKWTSSQYILLKGYLALARLEAARGEPAASFAYLDEAGKISREGARLAEAQRASLWLGLREHNPEYGDLAMQWGRNNSLVEFSNGPSQTEWAISITLAQLMIAETEPSLAGKAKTFHPGLGQLLEWLGRQVPALQARGRNHWEIQLRVIESLARRKMGDTHGALAALRRALDLAKPGGYVRTFVEAGEPLRNLLVELSNRTGGPSAYLSKVLSAFATAPSQTAHKVSPGEELIEALTAREVEVIQLVADGLSNHQIAEKLILAEGTVKFYVHSVLEKLGVHNRTSAVHEAKRLKLI